MNAIYMSFATLYQKGSLSSCRKSHRSCPASARRDVVLQSFFVFFLFEVVDDVISVIYTSSRISISEMSRGCSFTYVHKVEESRSLDIL